MATEHLTMIAVPSASESDLAGDQRNRSKSDRLQAAAPTLALSSISLEIPNDDYEEYEGSKTEQGKKKKTKSRTETHVRHSSDSFNLQGFRTPPGTVIHSKHAQYALTYGMMRGILKSAGLQTQVLFRQRLSLGDFSRIEKHTFKANAPQPHTFKFKDYAPEVFRRLRGRFALDSMDYILTLCKGGDEHSFLEFLSNSKSGQFFFYSHDGRFLIKTQTKDESKCLRRMLPHYYRFVMEHPHTLLPRFYGLHRVEMRTRHVNRKTHFVIMASVFYSPLEVHWKFDLKGSTVGRRSLPEPKQETEEQSGAEQQEQVNQDTVLKDLDLIDANFHLQLGTQRRAIFLVQLQQDVEFLKQMKIMDYSLLVGVHDPTGRQNPFNTCTRRRKVAQHMRIPELKSNWSTSKSLPNSPMAGAEKFWRSTRSESDPPAKLRIDEEVTSPATIVRSVETTVGRRMSDATAFVTSAEEVWAVENNVDDKSSSSNVDDSGDESVDTPIGSQHWHEAEDFDDKTKSLGSTDQDPSVFCQDDGGVAARDRRGRLTGPVYFLGIIDVLQQYNSRKMAENVIKGFRHDRNEISAVPPDVYGDRFLRFMEAHVAPSGRMSRSRPKSP